MGFRFDRAFYRLVYPMAFRPRFLTEGRTFEVIDLSEQGLRFLHPGPDSPKVGTPLAGVVRLPTGEALAVEGAVVRLALPSVALELVKGIPYSVMIEQQRFINQRTVVLS